VHTRTRMSLIIAALGSACLLGCPADQSASPTIRVATTGVDSADCGNTWANACATLAFANTRSAELRATKVFVAGGTYRPPATNESVVELVEGVAYYGGFAGTEISLAERIDPTLTPTILDGDFGADDPVVTDNSMHVVIGASGARLDGFTVRGGRAGPADPRGAGMLNDSIASITLSDVLFEDNRVSGTASAFGAGLYSRNLSSLSLTGVSFRDNEVSASATAQGGALFSDAANPELQNVEFMDNSILGSAGTQEGGALYVTGSGLSMTDTTFTNNAISSGTGMSSGNGSRGGAAFIAPTADVQASGLDVRLNRLASTSQPSQGAGIAVVPISNATVSMTDVSFANNAISSSGTGAGLYADNLTLTITDGNFAQNFATSGFGAGAHIGNSTATITDATFRSNGLSSGGGGGGGLHSVNSNTSLSGVHFSDNFGGYSGGNGGAILVEGGGNLALNAVGFFDNAVSSSSGFGGAIAARNTTITGADIRFVENRASGYFGLARGGAIDAVATTLTLSNVNFSGNEIYASFVGSASGPAVHLGSASDMTLTHTTFANNLGSGSRASGIAAIEVEGSTLTIENGLFGLNDQDVSADGSSTVALESPCSDLDVTLLPNVTANSATLATLPLEALPQGEYFLGMTSECLDRGDLALADLAYGPGGAANLSARFDGVLDTGVPDPGYHTDPNLEVRIDSASLTSTLDFTGNFPDGTRCDYDGLASIPVFEPFGGSVTQEEFTAGSVASRDFTGTIGLELVCANGVSKASVRLP